MRVNSVNMVQSGNLSRLRNVKVQSITKNTSDLGKDNVTFKGSIGKVAGGALGAGLCAIAAMATPVGWVAAATLIAAETGGAILGGAVGDAIEGKDEEEE